MHAVTKKWLNASVVGNTKADTSIKPLKAHKDAFVVPAEVALSHHNPCKEKVSETECIKKKKRKSQQSELLNNDGGTYVAETEHQHSSPALTKPPPHVKLKPVTKCVQTNRKRLKSRCSNSTSDSKSLSDIASKSVEEELSVDSSPPRKRRKMQNIVDDKSMKLKKIRSVNGRTDEMHADGDACSVNPNKHNFNIAKLRSALQQSGRFSDAVSDQDRLCDQMSFKNRTLPMDQESATTSAKHEKFRTDVSEASKSSVRSEMASVGSSSGLLKERMLKRLTSARFRFINEQMYRSTGREAAEMFAQNRDAFAVYHAGFQSQVSKWPTNPVDRMIDCINNR